MIKILFFAQNIDCGYTLEPPRRGGSNEYPQSMFWSKIYPCEPHFYYIKVGFKGVYLSRTCFPDVFQRRIPYLSHVSIYGFSNMLLLSGLKYMYHVWVSPIFAFPGKRKKVGKDQEKAQSEKDSRSKNRGGKKPN